MDSKHCGRTGDLLCANTREIGWYVSQYTSTILKLVRYYAHTNLKENIAEYCIVCTKLYLYYKIFKNNIIHLAIYFINLEGARMIFKIYSRTLL